MTTATTKTATTKSTIPPLIDGETYEAMITRQLENPTRWFRFNCHSGSKLLVRLLATGDHFGLNDCFQNKSLIPSVEFYGEDTGKPWYIGSYGLLTFIETAERGLLLHGAYPQYSLSVEDHKLVGKWLSKLWLVGYRESVASSNKRLPDDWLQVIAVGGKNPEG